jgi:ribonuclease P protein component
VTSGQFDTPRSRNDFQFRRTNRLLKSAEFRKVYDTGVRFSCPYFVAFLLRHTDGETDRLEGPRIGFTIPRTVGKAVLRNRIRRRIREMLRTRLHRIPAVYDLVLNPRRGAAEAPREELTRHVERLVERCV